MNDLIAQLEQRIYAGKSITFEEALSLSKVEDLDALLGAADRIREKFNGNKINLCTIMNAKSGRCSEDCSFCAQSAHFKTGVTEYPLISVEEALAQAKENESHGVHRFSLVTSGKGMVGEEFEKTLEIYRELNKNTSLHLCASLGIISYEQAVALKETGVQMYHHNLETSRRFFNQICTTHTYDERIETIENVKKAGMTICSGGIIGLGETVEDRISMAFEFKDLEVDSVPINVLFPVKGTPLEDRPFLSADEALRTIAVYRFILPKAHIRFAGGRTLLGEDQKRGFRGGANATMVGNLLTTVSNTIEEDLEMLKSLGLEV